MTLDAEADAGLGSSVAKAGRPQRGRLQAGAGSWHEPQWMVTSQMTGSHFVNPFAESQPTGSHHFKILVTWDMVHGDRRGKWVWYSSTVAVSQTFAPPSCIRTR